MAAHGSFKASRIVPSVPPLWLADLARDGVCGGKQKAHYLEYLTFKVKAESAWEWAA